MYCKNCGELLVFEDGQKTTVCELCGMEQTLPKIDDPKEIELLVKANEYRMASRFDVAKKQYESIIAQYPDDNEAYWCKLLCVYGIEYVDDFVTARKIPTCHRTVRESIFNNTDYKLIISRASIEEKAIYETEAKEIDRLQKEIIEKANKEQPYDIFICFKDSDENGRRTTDSQYANKIYTHFTRLGYKVFFSPVTLKSRAGEEYEPIIYSALYTAKVMLFVCANKEYVSAPWVRNEWSRFLEFMREDYTKVLLPCLKDVYPYDLPEELSKIQVMDITDIDFYESLTRQIDSKFGRVNTVASTRIEQNVTQSAQIVDGKQKTIHNYLERINIFLDDNDWQRVNEYAEKILDEDPKNARAYLVKTFFDFKVKSVVQLLEKPNFESNLNYVKVIKFADGELKTQLDEAIKQKEIARLDAIYNTAREELGKAKTEQDFTSVAELLGKIKTYKDSASLLRKCDEGKENIRKNEVYEQAKQKAVGENVDDYKTAIRLYESIPNWRDSKAQIGYCNKKIYEINTKIEAEEKEKQRCEELIKALTTAKYKADIDRKQKSEQEYIDGWKERIEYYEELKEKFPALKAQIAEIEKEVKKQEDRISALTAERSKLGLFAKKRKKEIEAEIEKEEDIKRELENKKKSVIEELDWHESISAIDESIAVCKSEIEDTEKILEKIKSIPIRDEIVAELYKMDIGKQMYESSEEYEKDLMRKEIANAKVGSTVKFGKYYQSNNTTKEDIEWQVLAKEDNRALLISKYGLDCKKYDETNVSSVTWKTCTLRKWLNNDFINSAFTEEEKAYIPTVTVSADENPIYTTDPGYETEDEIFLLSIPEANKYFSNSTARQCKSTAYAKKNGAREYSGNGNCWWWLRSPGDTQLSVASVNIDGDVVSDGYGVYYAYLAVRPALWVDLEPEIF